MRRLVLLSIVAGAAGWVAAASSQAPSKPAWVPDRGDGTYINPVLYADYSDPDVIRVGGDCHMTASSFNAVPGLPILHSLDMVNWRLIGHALPRLSPEDLFATPQHGKGPWAPALRHHNGRFWIYYPEPDLGIFVVTAALKFAPVAGGEAAGVIIFGQDYAWLGLRKTAAGLRLVLNVAKDARGGNPEHLVASVEAAGPMVYLRVTVTAGGKCRFAWSVDDSYFAPIGDEFVARPGVWVGAKVGIFAVARPGAAKTGHADWSWFHVEPPAGSS